MNVGVVGCGTISGIYLQNLTRRFPHVRVTRLADLVPERASARASEHGIPLAGSVEDLLSDPEVELVLNLTVPQAHAEVSLAAIAAGKHVYTEKPLAISLRDGEKILTSARKKGVQVGAAPDTFLGAGLQTCISLVNEGAIGMPVAAAAFMTSHGPETWHPDPAFYYAHGGGPVFDMAPYYFTALLALLGPAQRVSGSVKRTFPRRVVGSGPKAGEVIEVEVPTHAAGTIDFAVGAVVTFVMSFDVWHAQLPRIEIYGTDGSLSVPDPNTFGGPVRVRASTDTEWHDVVVPSELSENSRGVGLAEMVDSIEHGRPARASGALALHALEMMHAVHEASSSERYVTLRFPAPRPEPFASQEALDAVVR
ncbi:MAG TPA: Gfo/Idh/MocA family oxidoreductase [Spirochaetia bacterium]|nr:Gfo/Idh/MocA family oxidoreductase [Spirochaetia bacterium]